MKVILSTWTAAVSAAIVVGGWWLLQVFPPASFYFKAHSMIVPDVLAGDPVNLLVNREIRRPVFGSFVVTVRRQSDRGWVMHCPPARGSSDYSPGAAFPDPLTLEWWTEGQCHINTPGQYFITTTWTFYPSWIVGSRISDPLISNVFRVERCC